MIDLIQPAKLDPALPLSLALGAGGVRGFAHIGVLEGLHEAGFTVSEIVGTSAGAIIGAFYAAVGLDLAELHSFGANLTSPHLIAWAFLRRLPAPLRKRLSWLAGIIPGHLEKLGQRTGTDLHYGVERLGLVCFDLITRSEVFFHNLQPGFPLEEAARGSASIPGFFPTRPCVVNGKSYRLLDGGVINKLPVNHLYEEPFRPAQILAVDVSNEEGLREASRRKVQSLRSAFRSIPAHILTPETMGLGTILYKESQLEQIIKAGRRAIDAYLNSLDKT